MVDEEEIGRLLLEAAKKRRGYADFFHWPRRRVEEWRVADIFLSAAGTEPGAPFSDLCSREPGADPPDCEAVDCEGRRIGIELTELVDPEGIIEFRRDPTYSEVEWSREKLIASLEERLRSKDTPEKAQGGPYDEYLLLIYTDEPELRIEQIRGWLGGHQFAKPHSISRAYLLVSYDPGLGRYPWFRLRW